MPSESELIDLIYFNVISLIAVDAMCARLSFFVRVHDIVLMNLYANITKIYKSFPFMEEVTVANAIFFYLFSSNKKYEECYLEELRLH